MQGHVTLSLCEKLRLVDISLANEIEEDSTEEPGVYRSIAGMLLLQRTHGPLVVRESLWNGISDERGDDRQIIDMTYWT